MRDSLLGAEPVDYDIATNATPPEVAACFAGARLVGEAFGVVLVRVGGNTIEVATFRADGPYGDRRRPDHIEFSSPERDAQRRDFTINGLFQDPSTGTIIDFVNGEQDLKAGVIRAIGDPAARLAEDTLRTIRAVRFAARFGFTIEPATARAIASAASGLGSVSRERIGIELRKMLAHPARSRACALLEDLHLDAPTLGEPHVSDGATVVSMLAPDASWIVALAAWRSGRRRAAAAPAGHGDARSALVLSADESDMLAACEADRTGLPSWLTLPLAKQIRCAARASFLNALALAEAEGDESAGAYRRQYAALAARPGGLCPKPLVGGDDLIARGLTPGPRFKAILDAAYDLQLTGPILERSRAIEALHRVMPA